jgi:hypothetical protein
MKENLQYVKYRFFSPVIRLTAEKRSSENLKDEIRRLSAQSEASKMTHEEDIRTIRELRIRVSFRIKIAVICIFVKRDKKEIRWLRAQLEASKRPHEEDIRTIGDLRIRVSFRE